MCTIYWERNSELTWTDCKKKLKDALLQKRDNCYSHLKQLFGGWEMSRKQTKLYKKCKTIHTNRRSYELKCNFSVEKVITQSQKSYYTPNVPDEELYHNFCCLFRETWLVSWIRNSKYGVYKWGNQRTIQIINGERRFLSCLIEHIRM